MPLSPPCDFTTLRRDSRSSNDTLPSSQDAENWSFPDIEMDFSDEFDSTFECLIDWKISKLFRNKTAVWNVASKCVPLEDFIPRLTHATSMNFVRRHPTVTALDFSLRILFLDRSHRWRSSKNLGMVKVFLMGMTRNIGTNNPPLHYLAPDFKKGDEWKLKLAKCKQMDFHFHNIEVQHAKWRTTD